MSEDTIMRILQVILALTVLVLVHEGGHYTFARIFKIKVDKFFIFFDAGKFKLLSTKEGWFSKLFPSLKEKETEYGIGWLPIGGYCKISGMVDESMDTEGLKNEPQPWEFRTKAPWKRLLVLAGGVLFNLLFAIIISATVLMIWGESIVDNRENSIYVNELAYDLGFRNGDRILSIDGHEEDDFYMLQAELARKGGGEVLVLRDGDTTRLTIPEGRIAEILTSEYMFSPAVPFVVDSIAAYSANAGAGLMKGDRIISIDGSLTDFLQDALPIIRAKAGQSVDSKILRGCDTLTFSLQVSQEGTIGVYTAPPNVTVKEYGFFSSIPGGIAETAKNIYGYVEDLIMVGKPSTGAYKNVGSFISIGKVFPGTWEWYPFLRIVAMLSIMLSVMNILPIPGLDGGHILFTLVEMITGVKPGEKFLITAQMIGMVLIIALMLFACSNDIRNLLL